MSEENNKGAEEKSMLHPRSKHRQRYDFKALNAEIPQLKHYVQKNNTAMSPSILLTQRR